MRFLLRLFWGKCPIGITYHLKEVRISCNHQVHATRDRKKESIHTVADKSVTASKQTKYSSLFGGMASTGKWWWLSD